MTFKVDTSNKIIYLSEKVNWVELTKFCEKIGVDDTWEVMPETAINYYPVYPTYPLKDDNTAPWNPGIVYTYM